MRIAALIGRAMRVAVCRSDSDGGMRRVNSINAVKMRGAYKQRVGNKAKQRECFYSVTFICAAHSQDR
jgi:hypothetical protein